jgi:site-specific DNA-cytosine methylase|tara:strand:+ start:1003 stop:2235 length:1233 start_codon:yes stop_codon:yes gene_type:complete
MSKREITWAPLIPLIGGQMLGAEKAFGKPPAAIYSYDGFQDNDSHYVNYQQNTLGRKDIPYILLGDDNSQVTQVDVVSGTPPCAALSQLNTGKSVESKGAGCAKNEWMYKVFEDGIDILGAKVVIVENAPALFTNKGRPVANNLYKICAERGYSLTLYKTSTRFHGVPQGRDRSFAIGWKSESAPVMNWYNRPRKNFAEYLREIPVDALHQDIIINKNVPDEPYYNFIKTKIAADTTIRELMIEEGVKTTLNYVNKKGWMKEANEWFHKTGNEKGVKYSDHAMMKYADGKGVWDGSVHVFGEYMNAVIGRNMVDTIHPEEERSLTIREAMHMMGFPEDFELLHGLKKMNHIAQNCPVPTSRDMHLEIQKFLNEELDLSDTTYMRQNNFKQLLELDPNGKDTTPNLEDFFQ